LFDICVAGIGGFFAPLAPEYGRKEAFEAYKLQQEVQETLKWKWITKLGSSLGVVTIVSESSRACLD
jgi:hypothetical protein